MVDAADLKSAAARHVGSIPTGGTILTPHWDKGMLVTRRTNNAVHHMFTTNPTSDHKKKSPAEAGPCHWIRELVEDSIGVAHCGTGSAAALLMGFLLAVNQDGA